MSVIHLINLRQQLNSFGSKNGTDLTNDQSLELVYHYIPTNGLPVAVAFLFMLASFIIAYKIYHSTILLNHKYYLYILTLTCWAEAMGYICREITIYNITLTLYIIYLIAILLSPNALALVNYMTVGKIIGYADIHGSWLKPKYIPRFFVFADFLTFAIQGAAGAQLSSSDPSTQEKGANTFTIGVVMQLVFIASFIAVTYWADRKLSQQPEKRNQLGLAFKSLYSTIILITVRTIYRTVEYETANLTAKTVGYVSREEWTFYVFDTLPILSALAVYSYWCFIDTLPTACLIASYLGGASNADTGSTRNETVELQTIEVVEGSKSKSGNIG